MLEGALAENLVKIREAILPDDRTAHRGCLPGIGVAGIWADRG
jgi:hypothetical protein